MIVYLAGGLLLAIIALIWIRTARARRGWEIGHVSYEPKPSWEPAAWSTVLIGGLGPLVLLIAALVTASLAGEYRMDRTVPLAALSAGSATGGTFFLGTGTVDERPVFRYVERQSDGGATLESVAAKKAAVYEDAGDKQPHLDVYCHWLTASWITPFPIGGTACGYYFHVPAGSVLGSYEVTP